jgi:hypothetical protein
MRVIIDERTVQVRLSLWQKVLGLMGDITVDLADVSGVEVVQNPVRRAMMAGWKVGLRMPWVCYIGRTLSLDRAFVVRRGVPGLSFSVRNHGALASVLVSTPEALELAEQLSGVMRPPAGEGSSEEEPPAEEVSSAKQAPAS